MSEPNLPVYGAANGKGSKRRPCQVSREEFEKNWDRIFGKKFPAAAEIPDPCGFIAKARKLEKRRAT
jgi:hypothetical protein